MYEMTDPNYGEKGLKDMTRVIYKVMAKHHEESSQNFATNVDLPMSWEMVGHHPAIFGSFSAEFDISRKTILALHTIVSCFY